MDTKIGTPATYKGLQLFHRYWGKKPVDVSVDIVEKLCENGGIVLDPFMGSGLLSRGCSQNGKRFIGMDINPVGVELAKLFSDLPDAESYSKCLSDLRASAKSAIDKTYKTEGRKTATHFLWNRNDIESVWSRTSDNKRKESQPTLSDIELAASYAQYKPKYLRRITSFSNSRINATSDMSLNDIFKTRALANIDTLLEQILSIENEALKRSFLLTLTAASGQMSNFVFAIQNRGKKSETSPASTKTEVGSWSVGFWKPALHFEINVWNCFENRANRMTKILSNELLEAQYTWTDDVADFFNNNYHSALINKPAQSVMARIPEDSVDVIFTDPPHGDRIPYLELSEIWNSILQTDNIDFNNEIVVSNAKERNKTDERYIKDMQNIFRQCRKVLKPDGYMLVIYNSSNQDWNMLPKPPDWNFICRFDMKYSAGSLIQDNRKGAMREDYAFLFSKTRPIPANFPFRYFEKMPGFSTSI